MKKRLKHIIHGQVQGVGFRPFVYRIAHKNNLSGFVLNSVEGVIIEIEGNEINLNGFNLDFEQNLPPLAKITEHQIFEIEPINLDDEIFIIRQTEEGEHGGHSVLISADVATCKDCEVDILEPNNFRKGYAFTNCTSCGPRYTITHSIPYDRKFTSMACFPMCASCQAEYDDVFDRRFHAQPNACPTCGPKIWLNSIHDIEKTPEIFSKNTLFDNAALLKSIEYIKDGSILAIKGLGGFQLCCDAFDQKAIAELRIRKNRPAKAFAIMVADLKTAQELAHVSEGAKELLLSPSAPIVLCPKKHNVLPDNIAPDTHRIGIMLPYSPLHKILFNPKLLSNNFNFTPKALIMTSANAGGEPICIKNRKAIEDLKGIADYFLFHNRDILVRVDDSVCLALPDKKLKEEDQAYENFPTKMFFRRARGYVPNPINLPKILAKNTLDSVIGVGAHLKNTFCLTRGNEAFVSQHIGDLDNLSTMEFYEETFAHLLKLLEVKPQAVVCDLHPDFQSTKFAQEFSEKNNIELLALPHHYAHAYAVLAEQENYDLSACLALILDGTGLGIDQKIWGGELLYLEPKNHIMIRLGRISPLILPGGEAAIYEPWRIAQALYENCVKFGYLTENEKNKFPYPWLDNKKCAEISPLITQLLEKNIQCQESSGCGRLFDAVSALLGLNFITSYEGQAAIKLESAMDLVDFKGEFLKDEFLKGKFLKTEPKNLFSCPILENNQMKQERMKFFNKQVKSLNNQYDSHTPIWELDSMALFAHFVKNLDMSTKELALQFHQILANGFLNMIEQAVKISSVKKIVIAGGVMNNSSLLLKLSKGLYEKGLDVMLPKNMPCGDGAISLGQAFYGLLKMRKN